MGTFGGHALPGSFFIVFGLWYIYNIFRSFYRRKACEMHLTDKQEEVYVSRCAYPVECCGGRKVPLDSILKTIACLIGITGEVITGFDKNGKFVHIGNAQHSTMFASFGLGGIIEILIFYRILKTSREVEYILAFFALLSEAMLFGFHLHGRTYMDVYIHMLLFGMIILSLFAGIGEVLDIHQPTFALVRCWGLLMQGTWFWQVGAILYPKTSWMPKWDSGAKESISRAANLFCYHLLTTFTVILIIGSMMSLRLGRTTNKYGATRKTQIGSDLRREEDLSESMQMEDQVTLFSSER